MRVNFPPLRSGATCALALLMVASLPGCRKRGGEDTVDVPGQQIHVDSKLRLNRLGNIPSSLYQAEAGSSIHWQPWTPETFELARQAHRLVFVLIAMPQQPACLTTVRALADDAQLLANLNHEYVPVLVDGDMSREMGLITADLCSEIRRPLQLPLMVWMTHEGNPVAWIPVSKTEPSEIRALFDQSHGMVSRMWRDDPEYVLKNSRIDQENRRNRFGQRRPTRMTSDKPERDMVLALRQMVSLYDPFTRSFDQTGGLFPSGSLELLSVAARHPGLPDDLRHRCRETVEELLKDLLPSPVFDPLDGGVFSSRRGPSWKLPSFTRDGPTQARVATALAEAARATGSRLALDRAREVVAFAEREYATTDGLFSVGLAPATDPEDWMWTIEDIRAVLSEEDAAWWIAEAGMEGLGNLPSESDPSRRFFRANSLGLRNSPSGFAAAMGSGGDAFLQRFGASRAKLLEAREARLKLPQRDRTPNASATFRMVSTFAAMHAATGDESYRTKAVATLSKARETYWDGKVLRTMKVEAPDSLSLGRAFVYGLALQAALDVAALTRKDEWLVWAEDLATVSAEQFAGDGVLKECPDPARIVDVPVTDLIMLFEDSTAGIFSQAESRLAVLGRPLVPSFSALATPLPTYVVERPVLHSDLLLATMVRHLPWTVVYGSDLAEPLATQMGRLSLRGIHIRAAGTGDEVPAGAVKVLWPGEQSKVVTSADELIATIAELEKIASAP